MTKITVHKSERNESTVQFLDTALKLHIFTIKQCIKSPKRYTFYVSQKITDLSAEILNDVKRGNSYYPTNAVEIQTRRDCFLRACANLQALTSQIGVAKELFDLSSTTMMGWMKLICEEERLIKGVLKADKRRVKAKAQNNNETYTDKNNDGSVETVN